MTAAAWANPAAARRGDAGVGPSAEVADGHRGFVKQRPTSAAASAEDPWASFRRQRRGAPRSALGKRDLAAAARSRVEVGKSVANPLAVPKTALANPQSAAALLAAGDCDWAEGYGIGSLDGPAFALTTFDDGSGEALYVGGAFLSAGGVSTPGIAKWDGTSWSALGSGVDGEVYALAVFDDGGGPALYAGGYFTTAGGIAASNIAKWDGAAWSALGLGTSDDVEALVVFDDGGGPALYAGGFFAFAGGGAVFGIARWDGASWSDLDTGMNAPVLSLGVFAGELYAGGFFDEAGSVPVTAFGIARWNGTSWSDVDVGVSDFVFSMAVFDDGTGDALFVGGDFFAVGSPFPGPPVFSVGIAKWDGTDWSDLDSGVDDPAFFPEVFALTVFDDGGGDQLYVGGFFSLAGSVPEPVRNLAKWDGSDWSDVGGGTDADVFALKTFDDGGGEDLYLGGLFREAGGLGVPGIAQWDGLAFAAVAPPDLFGMDDVVFAFEMFDDGSGPALYAGGDFFTAGGVVVHGIAKWDGTSWSPLGSGMACEEFFPFPEARTGPKVDRGIVFSECSFPTVQALAVYDDGGGPALYAGGIFDLAGGVPAANVARWDGTTWSALGDGTNDIVEALAVYDDGGGPDLYAGGEFDFAGAVAVSNIARWDGTAWSALGLGVDSDVETLAVYDDGGGPDLYAGGEFNSAGGVPADFIARWDGATWSALGLGTDDEVETLLVYDDGSGPDLYVGGQFDSAGGVAAPSIARWDGTAWSALGSGMSSAFSFRTVDALAAFDDGLGPSLYAGGFFDLAGGLPASNIARWDGAAWSALGSGTNEEIEALAVFNVDGPSLYAGGFFTEAGGFAASYIGEWRCAPAELTIDDVTLAEGDAGTTDFVFTITRSHNANDLSVDVETADGVALAGADYTALPLQTITFAAGGLLSAAVTVSVITDTVEEAFVEDFFVNLSSPVAATIVDSQGVGTILDDDDNGAPTVTAVDSTAGTGDGELAECEEARVAVSLLHVTFDQPVRDPAGDSGGDDVTNPANYRLFAAGPDSDLDSAACAPPSGDDLSLPLAAVTYDAGSRTATVDPTGGALGDGPYRLVVCDTILDLGGNGLASGDFARTFRVEQASLFVNGHLDCDLEGWTAVSTLPAEIAHAGDDADGADISGSVALTNLSSSTDFSFGQCVPVSGGSSYTLRGEVRLAAGPGVVVFLSRSCEVFAAAGCTGPSLGSTVDVFPFGDTAGAWQTVESEIDPPAGSASAFCAFRLTTPGGEAFSAHLDDLELLRVGGIFSDGFESGDTSAWSATVP